MTTKHDDGGPAFPSDDPVAWNADGSVRRVAAGMSLLDYFAGQAVQQLASIAAEADKPGEYTADTVAIAAYNIARAMVAEKRRREQEGA